MARKRWQWIKRDRAIRIHGVCTFARNSECGLCAVVRSFSRADSTQLHRRKNPLRAGSVICQNGYDLIDVIQARARVIDDIDWWWSDCWRNRGVDETIK